MKYLFPILLIAAVSYFACNRTAKTDPSTTQSTTDNSKQAMKAATGKAVSGAISEAPVKHKPVPQPELTAEETEKLLAIDEYVSMAQREKGKSLKSNKATLQFFTDDDFLAYTTQENKVVEAILVSKDGDFSKRHYYYFKNGAFLFCRNVEWNIGNILPYAQETIIFFDNDEIINVEQRRLELEVGENQNNLLNEKFIRLPVDKKAIKQEVTTLWAKLFKEIEEIEIVGNNG